MSTMSIDAVRRALAERGISHVGPEDLVEFGGHAQQDGGGEGGAGGVEFLRTLHREFSGLGILTELFMDPDVTDVLVNPDGSIWIDRGEGLEIAEMPSVPPGQARELAVRLAARCGARLDNAMPFADGVLTDLPEGIPARRVRVHAALAPPMDGGASISLRALHRGHSHVADLVRDGMMSPALGMVLRQLVRQRMNILISGGTGAGKTTLLTALLGEVPDNQRMILVEDTPEIIAEHPHCLAMTARRANAEGAGDIPMGRLVTQCLRMRPDRIIVGEIRGAEIADLLVALNTGHPGSAGTLHANDPQAVPGRLEALGAMADMPPRSLVRQSLDGIDVLLHVERTPQGRKLTDISTLHASHSGDGAPVLTVEPVWSIHQSSVDAGDVVGRIQRQRAQRDSERSAS
ncbi:TadA family conjugal transfer-associated ATPase [Corynebacterium zhongnanshanii]|uniref:TadA family conjugal transfer-associated ATPase n=1 Tax=Corynebacterium zhongnanshanii TaxID=2768834 RepID=A0ABQ6VDY6_9CORY|nr:TadA family conjugal transfer-associated ATPase [Corynebacterium zhongnanshanii]KAB3522641.1 TadA family conjugal transfer-associated ATPase [Corynebacterium zhongnanshanii]